MRLAEIPRPSAVFIDANIFVYHFPAMSDECTEFLGRVERGELRGFTGQLLLLETAHRLMVLEALERGLPAGANPAARLARRPDLIKRLSKYYFSVAKVAEMRVDALPLPPDFLARSQEYRQAHGLLINDSLVPLQMREAGISILASADAAFDRIPWIQRAAPSDI